mgnify:CR=1 FL=1
MFIIFIVVYSIVIFKLVLKFINNPARKKNDSLYTVFAPPGCGKTTLLAWLALRFGKKCVVYGNVPLKDVPNYYLIDWSMIGTYDFRDCVILIDEASIEANNRQYKSMLMSTIKYLKLHRHYRAQMYFFSQSHDDIDVTIRRLSDRYYLVSKSIFFFITKRFILRQIKKTVGINDEKLVADAFEFVPLSKFKYSGRKVFKHFDSFSAPALCPVPFFHDFVSFRKRGRRGE